MGQTRTSFYTLYNDETVSQLPQTATFDAVLRVVLTVHGLGITCTQPHGPAAFTTTTPLGWPSSVPGRPALTLHANLTADAGLLCCFTTLHLSEEGAENGTPATILFPSIP